MLSVSEQGGVVTAGPWASRDGFIAETAVKLDRLQAKFDRLSEDGEAVKRQVGELVSNAEQTDRFRAFEESLRNAREYRIDDVMRCVKTIKSRLDRMEGQGASYSGLMYKNFESVDSKLKELSEFQLQIRAIERKVRVNAMLFCASLAIFGAALITKFA